MQISRRMEKISPSLTLAFNTRAQEMRAQGIDVLNLAAGEPDFPNSSRMRQKRQWIKILPVIRQLRAYRNYAKRPEIIF